MAPGWNATVYDTGSTYGTLSNTTNGDWYAYDYSTGSSSSTMTINWKKSTYSKSQWRSIDVADLQDSYDRGYRDGQKSNDKLKPGQIYTLPDGAKLLVDKNGNYRIEDRNAQVTYKAHRNRDFSPHINASDMVADFFKYVRDLGVPKSEMMKLPMELFISWLIIEAAERDGDDVSDITPIAESPKLITTVKPRCLWCGRYIDRLRVNNGFSYCDPEHAAKRMIKEGILLQQVT